MGYLISAHIARELPNLDRIGELPESIGCRIYHHQSADVYLIDAFRASRPPVYPFQTPLPAGDVPLEVASAISSLESVYAYLNKRKLANSFKMFYINFAILLNRLLKVSILSFITDDDEWDFACVANEGALCRLRCRCEDLVITYDGASTQIQPLSLECDDGFLTNLDDLRAEVPNVTVHERNVPWNSQLHAIAIEEWRRFIQSQDLILGLGSFDPPEDELQWKLISERGSVE